MQISGEEETRTCRKREILTDSSHLAEGSSTTKSVKFVALKEY